MAKHSKLRRMIFGIIGLLILLAFSLYSQKGQYLEQLTLDFRYKNIQRNIKINDQLLFVDINESSLIGLESSVGRWPWPRSVYKTLLEHVSLSNPKSFYFDILFSERSQDTEQDLALAQTSANLPFVSHALKFERNTLQDTYTTKTFSPELLKHSIDHLVKNNDFASQYQFDYHDYLAPNVNLLPLSPLVHSVTADLDEDGVYRNSPLIVHYDGHWFPTLALSAVIRTLGITEIYPLKEKILLKNASRTYEAPVNSRGTTPINFYPEPSSLTTYSAGLLLANAKMIADGNVDDPESLQPNPLTAFENKIIVLGSSATGLQDLKSTPVSKSLPGAFIHLNLISNILQQDFLKRVHPLVVFFLVTLILASIYYGILFVEFTWFKTAVPLVFAGLYYYASILLFKRGFDLPLFAPICAFSIATLDSFAYMTFVEGRARKKITSTLSKYLSPDVAKQLAESGVDPTAEVGHKQELSILFSDIRGFTTMSERLPAEAVVTTLNEYLGHMTDLVFQEKGTLDKFIGDAVMAFWGAPIASQMHAKEAVTCALRMSQKLEELNHSWSKKGQANLAIGIGINTGQVIVGNIGSERRLDYTVIGDNVNMASRIEGLTKLYGVNCLIGERTYALIKEDFLCRPIDKVVAKGKKEPVWLYEPLCKIKEATKLQQTLAKEFDRALALYMQGEFKECRIVLGQVLELVPNDGPSLEFLDRCETLIETPPSQWDGTFAAKSK